MFRYRPAVECAELEDNSAKLHSCSCMQMVALCIILCLGDLVRFAVKKWQQRCSRAVQHGVAEAISAVWRLKQDSRCAAGFLHVFSACSRYIVLVFCACSVCIALVGCACSVQNSVRILCMFCVYSAHVSVHILY